MDDIGIVRIADLRPSPLDLGSVVDQLCTTNSTLVRHSDRVPCAEPLPSRDVVHGLVESLRSVLFPGFFGTAEIKPETLRFHLGHTLDRVERELQLQVRRSLAFACVQRGETEECTRECDTRARMITDRFLAQLPAIQRLLGTDVRAAYEGDPAATSPDEAIFSYPGILAVTNYRVAHALHVLGVPVLPRVITEQAHSITGIDIHPGATIGVPFAIDHGTGIVIGETATVGVRVRIYQGVTLGALSVEKGLASAKRHPTIGDDVILYANATVLGGRTVIGAGSVIGGNVWLTRSVAAGSVVVHQPMNTQSNAAANDIFQI